MFTGKWQRFEFTCPCGATVKGSLNKNISRRPFTCTQCGRIHAVTFSVKEAEVAE